MITIQRVSFQFFHFISEPTTYELFPFQRFRINVVKVYFERLTSISILLLPGQKIRKAIHSKMNARKQLIHIFLK
ncbi:hypothetical protein OKW21_001781 [Catalinimonas alkaloidigena]|nr:hypothetical protein [Catalinimonas alkaloidigena]